MNNYVTREKRSILLKGGKNAQNLIRRAAALGQEAVLMGIMKDTSLSVSVRYMAALKLVSPAQKAKAVRGYVALPSHDIQDYDFLLFAGQKEYFDIHTIIINFLLYQEAPALPETGYQLMEKIILRAMKDKTINNTFIYQALSSLPQYEGYPEEWIREVLV